jgi:hypothetical protein
LGEFLLIGQVFTWVVILKITEVAQNFRLLLAKVKVAKFGKQWSGLNFG